VGRHGKVTLHYRYLESTATRPSDSSSISLLIENSATVSSIPHCIGGALQGNVNISFIELAYAEL